MQVDAHPQYPNPIIQEAVCQIGFHLKEGTEWNSLWFGKFFDAVKVEFPNLQPFGAPDTINISMVGSSRPNVNQTPATQVMRYVSERSTIIQLSDSSVTINVLPKYAGWNQMSEDIRYAWSKVMDVVKPHEISSIGLRYINRFEREKSDETLRDWIVPTDYVPQAILNSLPRRVLSHVQAQIDLDNAIKVVVGEVISETDSLNAFVFDIDRIFKRDSAPDLELVARETLRLHDDIWEVFKNAKGEKLEKLLNGELV